ncbi:MBL fold metallo-hydrolase [candidate division KSB3 bacterium]|uniref:MBL fold metallo-hydrolase n=1 Tax=candidate division KSB3 bacterium TaxID=2044937 RepID=A0A9D5JRW4_9BACT|nr:MBL fold metallo-hydrolase [candidate division KSB3 bacterium]MBD3323124.1 MBL fold metallo-hydrolase [candidate division KSB3 bacterium]
MRRLRCSAGWESWCLWCGGTFDNVNTLRFLGTGTSSGVPILGCDCETCRSDDPHDTRFRTSAYITTATGTQLLIDAGPDFRLQALKHDIRWLDGILITHTHNDHIGGLDELRQLNFLMKRPLDIYGNELTLAEIQSRFRYIFTLTQEGGGKPQLELHRVEAQRAFAINGQTILPLEVFHGVIPILGFQIGDLSYITDASFLPPNTLEALKHTKILVLNALRFRYHPTHFTLEQSLEIIRQIQPDTAYLVHMTHDIKHAEVEHSLPPNVHLAYDDLAITF